MFWKNQTTAICGTSCAVQFGTLVWGARERDTKFLSKSIRCCNVRGIRFQRAALKFVSLGFDLFSIPLQLFLLSQLLLFVCYFSFFSKQLFCNLDRNTIKGPSGCNGTNSRQMDGSIEAIPRLWQVWAPVMYVCKSESFRFGWCKLLKELSENQRMGF